MTVVGVPSFWVPQMTLGGETAWKELWAAAAPPKAPPGLFFSLHMLLLMLFKPGN